MQEFDQSFFESVFYENYDKIYTRFFKKTGSEIVADDLAQQTFIKFWEYRHAFKFDLPLGLQLNRNAKLVFIDWLRKEAHQRKIKTELSASNLPESVTKKIELTDTIKTALNQLPPMRKKVFQMAYIDGYSRKEIASQLQLSIRTVDAHINQALQQLRKVIALAAILSVILK